MLSKALRQDGLCPLFQAKGEDAAYRGIYGAIRGIFVGKAGTNGGGESSQRHH